MEGHEAIRARHLTHSRPVDSDVAPEGPVRELFEEREEGWRGLDWLGRRFDLSRISSGLVGRLQLAPQLYYPDQNGPSFEFQRTPNKFPCGRITFGGAGLSHIKDAGPFANDATGGPFDLTAIASREWKLLGGQIASDAVGAAVVSIRTQRAPIKILAFVRFAAAGSQWFELPGNGARLGVNGVQSLDIFCSAASNIDFVLWVAEEPEHKA